MLAFKPRFIFLNITFMKKFFLLITLVTFFVKTSVGQIAFSPEIGVNLADLSFGNNGYGYGGTGLKAGLAAGCFADIRLSDHFYLQPGLFYLMTGCEVTGWYGTSAGSINVNTIEIPLNIEFKFGNDGGGRLFIGGGPYVAFNISGSQQLGGTSTKLSIGNEAQDTLGNGDNLKPVDFGISSNIGYMFAGGFYFRISNQVGLVNLNPPSYYGQTIQSSSVSFTIGYLIRGSKVKRNNGQFRKFYRHG
jgi:hypothetical protein